MNHEHQTRGRPDRKTRGAIGVALAGVGIAALAGAAMGFEHTVAVARSYGAPAYWDVITAASVEILPITGTALLYVCHRLGWPTDWPYRVIMLGSILTLGAQLLWYGNDGQAHATADPQILGYAVAALPSIVTLTLIGIGHAVLGYADRYPQASTQAMGPRGVPEVRVPPALVSGTPPLGTRDEAPSGEPVPKVRTRRVPEPPAGERRPPSTRRPVAPAQEKAIDDLLRVVMELPRSDRTGKPGIKAIRAALKVGQDRAKELQKQAFPGGNEDEEGKNESRKEDENQKVIEGDSEEENREGEEEGGQETIKEIRSRTIATSVDQGSARPAADPEATPLRLVGGDR